MQSFDRILLNWRQAERERRRGTSDSNVLQADLTVAGGVSIPVGHRSEGLEQPRPLEDKGSQRWDRHCG